MTANPAGQDTLEAKVFQAIGFASMCWEPIPTGVFANERAQRCGEKLLADIRAYIVESAVDDLRAQLDEAQQ